MKHTIKITLFLVAIFLVSQMVGLVTVNKYIQVKKTPSGEVNLTHPSTFVGTSVKFNESQKLLNSVMITLVIIIATVILFLLIRSRISFVWKYWYIFAVFISIGVTCGVYLKSWIASGILALVLTYFKIYKRNIYTHNLTEPLIYTGITVLFLPFFNLIAGFLLLVFISIYDMYAVWKSKHMIKLAKWQSKEKIFAGLLIPYKLPKKIPKKSPKKYIKVKTAVLGGGDVAFPMIFSGIVMEHLIVVNHIAKSAALLLTGIIPLFATIALLWLLLKAKKEHFYPAMPFISAGCLAGYLVVYLINL